MFVDITFFQSKENNYATKVQIKNENNNIILYYSSFANHYSRKKPIFALMKHTYYPQGMTLAGAAYAFKKRKNNHNK